MLLINISPVLFGMQKKFWEQSYVKSAAIIQMQATRQAAIAVPKAANSIAKSIAKPRIAETTTTLNLAANASAVCKSTSRYYDSYGCDPANSKLKAQALTNFVPSFERMCRNEQILVLKELASNLTHAPKNLKDLELKMARLQKAPSVDYSAVDRLQYLTARTKELVEMEIIQLDEGIRIIISDLAGKLYVCSALQDRCALVTKLLAVRQQIDQEPPLKNLLYQCDEMLRQCLVDINNSLNPQKPMNLPLDLSLMAMILNRELQKQSPNALGVIQLVTIVLEAMQANNSCQTTKPADRAESPTAKSAAIIGEQRSSQEKEMVDAGAIVEVDKPQVTPKQNNLAIAAVKNGKCSLPLCAAPRLPVQAIPPAKVTPVAVASDLGFSIASSQKITENKQESELPNFNRIVHFFKTCSRKSLAPKRILAWLQAVLSGVRKKSIKILTMPRAWYQRVIDSFPLKSNRLRSSYAVSPDSSLSL